MESDVGTPSHIPTEVKLAEAVPLLRQSRIADVITASSLFGLLRGLSYPRRGDKLRSSGNQREQLNSEKQEGTGGHVDILVQAGNAEIEWSSEKGGTKNVPRRYKN